MGETDSNWQSRTLLLRALFLIAAALALCLALLTLLGRSSEFDFSVLAGNEYLGAALLLQVCGLGLFVLAWHFLLRESATTRTSLMESAAHIGVTLLGKYLPGKIWGLLGRGYLLSRRGVPASNTASLLLADQFLTFYSGLLIGIIALLAVYSPVAGLLALALGLVSSPIVLKLNFTIISWIAGKAARWFHLLDDGPQPLALQIRAQSLITPLLIYTLHWLVISLVLVLLFLPLLEEQLASNTLLLVSAIPLAMLTGFLALWAPGGIGVREAVIIAILSLNLELELATTIAISYRLLCVLNDLVMGSLAIGYYGRDHILSR